MQIPVVQTKLHVPHLRPELVHRSRLIAQLASECAYKLVLITAPAGFGKTTLVTSWLAQQRRRVAWVSLDEGDNDPLRFLLYVIAALNQCADGIGRTALGMLYGPDPPLAKTSLTYLINDLACTETPLILALDDYHLIHSQDVHDILAFLLNNLPPMLQIVLISRTEPPLPLARLRSRHHLVQLTAPDLRFTPAETELFLNQTMRLGLTNEQIAQLESKTEGWIAGLQLIALTIKNSEDADRLIHSISGDSRYIADYLVDEVLSHQPQRVVEFLLQTSVLGRMGAHLCNAVLGIEDSRQILDGLEKSNLFVIPLDDARTWYRYHHLFADMLCRRLAQQAPDRVNQLHRLAARWFLDHNMVEDAISHWLDAEEYGIVTEYLHGRIDDEILAQGKFRLYLAWLDRIPDAYLVKYPKLILYRVFQLWEMQDLIKFRQQLRLVEHMLGAAPPSAAGLDKQTATYHGIFAVIRGVVNCGAFATRPAAQCFDQALRLLPEESIFWRTLSLGATGFCHRVEGNYAAAAVYFARVLQLAPDSGLDFLTFMYSTAAALVHLAQGQLEAAIAACRVPIALDEKLGHTIPFAGLAHSVMGLLLYLSDDLAGAERHATRGIDLIAHDGDSYFVAEGYYTLAQIRIAQGDMESALLLVEKMVRQVKRQAQSSSALVIAQAYQVNIWLACQRLTSVAQWVANPGDTLLAANQYPDIVGLAYFGIYCTVHESFKSSLDHIHLTQARCALAAGQAEQALHVLDALLNGIALGNNNVFFKLQVLSVKALALYKLGAEDEALSTVLAALALVAPQPFYNVFLRCGQPMVKLLERARGLPPDNPAWPADPAPVRLFLDRILVRAPAPAAPKAGSESSIFDLTPRELEVLAWLAQGISYAEAADKLMVSENTVKTHLKHIYSKLDVTNRLQAVNRAKELNLLT